MAAPIHTLLEQTSQADPVSLESVLAAEQQATVAADATYESTCGNVHQWLQTPGQHSYLICLDPADEESWTKMLEYAKDRIVKAGDRAVLFSVLPVSQVSMDASSPHSPPIRYTELNSKQQVQLKASVSSRIEEAVKSFPKDVDVHACLRHGDIVTEIIMTAKYHECDAVLLTRRKRTLLQRWLGPGSVSSAILTNTDLTVIVVR